jgi:hypothetical protein
MLRRINRSRDTEGYTDWLLTSHESESAAGSPGAQSASPGRAGWNALSDGSPVGARAETLSHGPAPPGALPDGHRPATWESCNRRWADVDWRAEVATLTKTKAGKVQHAPLSAEAVALLRALGPGSGDGYVFAWPDGHPWSASCVSHAFAKAVEDAEITDLHVHGLRHMLACRRLRAGVDIYTVSKLIQHASVVMSEGYAHLSQNDLKASVEWRSMLQAGSDGEVHS